jgi:hypothetical protein
LAFGGGFKAKPKIPAARNIYLALTIPPAKFAQRGRGRAVPPG